VGWLSYNQEFMFGSLGLKLQGWPKSARIETCCDLTFFVEASGFNDGASLKSRIRSHVIAKAVAQIG